MYGIKHRSARVTGEFFGFFTAPTHSIDYIIKIMSKFLLVQVTKAQS